MLQNHEAARIEALEEKYLPRLIQLFGDDVHTRELFAAIVSEHSNVEALAAFERNPEGAARGYGALGFELSRRCEVGVGRLRTNDPARVLIPQILGYLYLGTFPGTEEVSSGFGLIYRSMVLK